MSENAFSSAIDDGFRSEYAVLFPEVRKFLGMDLKAFGRAICAPHGLVLAIEQDPKCRIPLFFLERVLRLVDCHPLPAELDALLQPARDLLKRRNYARTEGLGRTYGRFMRTPNEHSADNLRQAIADYLANFRCTSPTTEGRPTTE